MCIRDSIQEYGNHLSDTLKQKYQLSFLYESKLSLPEDIGNQMRSYFEQNRNKEILLCRTLRWPHLDDWSIQVMWENEPIASTNYLSRGENKMIFLALVKILSNFIESKTSKPILYLLDDVFAELDDEKRDVIWDLIQDHSAILSSQNPHDGWETVDLNN